MERSEEGAAGLIPNRVNQWMGHLTSPHRLASIGGEYGAINVRVMPSSVRSLVPVALVTSFSRFDPFCFSLSAIRGRLPFP